MHPSSNNGLYAATIVQQKESEIMRLKTKLETANQKFDEMKKQMVETHVKEMNELNSLKSRNEDLSGKVKASTILIKRLNQDMDTLKGKQETERDSLKSEHETNINRLNDRLKHAQNSPFSHMVINRKHDLEHSATAKHTKGLVDALGNHWLNPFTYKSPTRADSDSTSDYV